VFIFFFIVFLYYSFGATKTIEGVKELAPEKKHGMIKSSLYIIFGLGGLVLGGKWIVDGAVKLASSFGVSQTLVGLTIVAVGTSLPELATSAVAAYKKNAEIAVGNVVGSNIFNIFFVLGVSSVIKSLSFQMKQNIDIGVMVFANLILFISMFSGKRRLVDRWEGILFILFYFFYLAFLVIQG
jgi:cation:H+ antiporter